MTFKLPTKTEWMVSQMEHEPSRQYSQEIYELVKTIPYNSALEIGAAWGLSTLSILLAGKGQLISVDKVPTVKAIEEVEINGLNDRWRFINQPSSDFWVGNQSLIGTFDLIYIDGSHLFEDVYIDLKQGWKYLKKGGVLFLDDYNHKNNQYVDMDRLEPMYGVSYASWLLVQEENITNIKTTSRLLILTK